jgi:two-component system sensor histidine kinase AauS
MMQSPSTHTVSPALNVKPRLFRHICLTLLLVLCVGGIGHIGYRLSEEAGIRHMRETGERQLELHARAVESEVERYSYLPSVLELESSVANLLINPTPYRRHLVNTYLEGLNRRSEARAIYLLDTSGRVMATSNWRDADSYLGEDLSFRAYFQEAIRGRRGGFYGIGSTTGEAGYYLAHGLSDKGRIIGVAVVKVKLEPLQERWERARLHAFVSDENGIIILSSDPALRMKAVRPLSPEDKEKLARSLQYHWWALNEWQPRSREQLTENLEAISFSTGDDDDEQTVSYLAQSRPLGGTAWQFTLLSPLADIRREALSQGMLASVGFALLAFLFIAWNERRKVIATRLAAREALLEANSELERRIADRTRDLRASNGRLRAEIHDRKLTEENLRKAQDGLVQAGKLAVIGQMSTSIAHELNQPLAALRTLSGNTVRFLQRGALDTASANLETINELIDRMGRITASLRAFARRSDDNGQASLGKAVDAALFLLQTRLDNTSVELRRGYHDVVLGIDQTRLEQILVNLIANALDAVKDRPDGQVQLIGEIHDERYHLQIRDNGVGIDPALRAQLFEPFFTTKPGEQGLGLGLTLSASLATAAGGSLAAHHPDNGGTAFELILPLLPSRALPENSIS